MTNDTCGIDLFDPFRVGVVFPMVPVGVAHGYLIRPLRGRKTAIECGIFGRRIFELDERPSRRRIKA